MRKAKKPIRVVDNEDDDIKPSDGHSIDSLTEAVASVSVVIEPVPESSGNSHAAESQIQNDSEPVVVEQPESKQPVKQSKYTVVEGHRIRTSIHNRLYQYQIEGLKFMLHLFNKKEKGCILADDMGLGKTIQTIVLLSSLLKEEKIRSVLIVAPTTLLINWGKEFKVSTFCFILSADTLIHRNGTRKSISIRIMREHRKSDCSSCEQFNDTAESYSRRSDCCKTMSST